MRDLVSTLRGDFPVAHHSGKGNGTGGRVAHAKCFDVLVFLSQKVGAALPHPSDKTESLGTPICVLFAGCAFEHPLAR